MQYAWTCGCCGKQFSTLPEGWMYKAPDAWVAIPAAERESRGKCDADLCHIKGTGFFVRGCLEVPIIGSDQRYIWGVWAMVAEDRFWRILDLWSAPDAESEPPIAGRLANAIKIYPPLLDLPASLRLRSNNQRPAIMLEAAEHPLALEQRHGIAIERVLEITAALSPHH